MKKKILICSNMYPPNFIGGAELIAHSQAKQLQSHGLDVIIFTGDPSEQGRRHSLRREDYEGLPVYRVRLTYEDYDPKFANFIHKDVEEYFKAILIKFSPDIVHFHNLIGLSVGLIHLAHQQGIKTVLTLHDYWGFCYKNTTIKNDNEICRDNTRCAECMEVIPDENNRNIPMRMRQDFIAMQLEDIDAFILPSRFLADTYARAGIPREKMHVIWNGIDVEKFSQIKKVPDPDHIRFTFIGYFGMHKGIHILLDALQYLDDPQKITVNLVGDGELLARYKNIVHERNFTGMVKFWGKIKRIEDAYAQSDVLILPSIWPENQPVSITEAMSAGIPVIASDGGGIPELIEHGKTGLLVTMGNARDLAEKMNEIVHYPGKIKILGDSAYEKIKNHSVERQVQKITELYTRIPEKRREIPNGNTLIVCHGKHVDRVCADALNIVSEENSPRKILYVLSDWLYADQIKTGALFWIVDESEDLSSVDFGIRYELPLLVPEKNAELKKFCMKHNCGLFYRNSLEAGYAIQYILNNENVRIKMIKNGVNARGSLPGNVFYQ